VLAVNKYQARIEHLARTDPLTGAANRRELEERFDLAAYRASRDGIPFSILIIDLDGFKEVNDRLGHLAGDEVLASMARVIRGRLRPTDLLARWGGDEFIILLDGNEESARALARRISAAVCAAPDIPVGFSSGVAAYRDSDDLTSLTRRADNAMYQAKARGGDCVMAAEDL
jgi:diguanylate cyclase (GGDEF)-like protein